MNCSMKFLNYICLHFGFLFCKICITLFASKSNAWLAGEVASAKSLPGNSMFQDMHGMTLSSVPMLQLRCPNLFGMYSTSFDFQHTRSKSKWSFCIKFSYVEDGSFNINNDLPQIKVSFLLLTELLHVRVSLDSLKFVTDLSLMPLVIKARGNTRRESAKVRNRRMLKKVFFFFLAKRIDFCVKTFSFIPCRRKEMNLIT